MLTSQCLECGYFHSSDLLAEECAFVGKFFANFSQQASAFEGKILFLPWDDQNNFFPIKDVGLRYNNPDVCFNKKGSQKTLNNGRIFTGARLNCLDNELRIVYFCPQICSDMSEICFSQDSFKLKGYDLIERFGRVHEILDLAEAYRRGFRISASEEWKRYAGANSLESYNVLLDSGD